MTGTPMAISESNQSAGISFDPISTSSPSDVSRTLLSVTAPVISKLIVAICPDPLTPVVPGRLNSTRIASASVKFHASISIFVPPMFPS